LSPSVSQNRHACFTAFEPNTFLRLIALAFLKPKTVLDNLGRLGSTCFVVLVPITSSSLALTFLKAKAILDYLGRLGPTRFVVIVPITSLSLALTFLKARAIVDYLGRLGSARFVVLVPITSLSLAFTFLKAKAILDYRIVITCVTPIPTPFAPSSTDAPTC
jgi:GGDEF domain-containing protein